MLDCMETREKWEKIRDKAKDSPLYKKVEGEIKPSTISYAMRSTNKEDKKLYDAIKNSVEAKGNPGGLNALKQLIDRTEASL